MKKNIQKEILDSIKSFDTVIICRHRRPDGDAVGASLGLYRILKATFPEKQIFLANEDRSAYTDFLGDEGPAPAPELYPEALAVVVDTGTVDRIANNRISLCRKIIKIDHHIDDSPFGDISWVEENASSACELITDFYLTFKKQLVLPREAAECLYCGLVTDSGRFRFRGTSAATLRCAAELLARGIDTETLFAHLYMGDYKVLLQRAELTKLIRMTPNGVAYLDIPRSLRESMDMTMEDAGNTVSLMELIRGSLIWIAFIENDDASIRVRLRSRFVTVQELATRYHGGGHACASGATAFSGEEKEALLQEADALLGDFKKSHPDRF